MGEFRPSLPGERRGGRAKGTPNKSTALLKDAILEAAEDAHEGGMVGYLKYLAMNNTGAFASLLGKVLPLTLAGDPDAPLEHKHTGATDAERAAAVLALLGKK